MAVKSKNDLMESIRTLLGENTSDEAIAVIEDISDTVDDYEARTADQTDWHRKHDECDAAWRKRYTERFYGTDGGDKNDPPGSGNSGNHIDDNQSKSLTFDKLFKEG